VKRWLLAAVGVAFVAVAFYVGAIVAANYGIDYRIPRFSN
jgi:hypothetical protein